MEKKTKIRSPNYPQYSLERCIESAKILNDKYARVPTPFELAIKAIGLSPKSSSGLQAMASLSYYELIEITGIGVERRIKITDLAFKILIDKRPESKERDAAIKEAALNPTFFKKIKEVYGNQIPDDSLLEYDLPIKFKFNPRTVKEFIRSFKDTMTFAKVYETDIMPDENELQKESGMITQGEKAKAKEIFLTGIAGKEREKAAYSLGGDLKVRIVFSGNSVISEKAIEKLMKLLDINKEDFVEESHDEKESQ